MAHRSKKEVIPIALDAVAADSIPAYCARFSMSLSAFFEEVKAGKIETVKHGRRTLIPRSQILRRLDEIESEARRQADGESEDHSFPGIESAAKCLASLEHEGALR